MYYLLCDTGLLLLCQYNFLGHAIVFPEKRKVFHGLLLICWGELLIYLDLISLIFCLIWYRYWLWYIQLQGPLAWALIVWRCSLVFNSFDKIVSVFIHLLPGKFNTLPTLLMCVVLWACICPTLHFQFESHYLQFWWYLGLWSTSFFSPFTGRMVPNYSCSIQSGCCCLKFLPSQPCIKEVSSIILVYILYVRY